MDPEPTGDETADPNILPVLQVPDPRLRTVADPVESIHDEEVKQAIANLRATSKSLRFGGGLAAPQLGIPLRIVFIDKSVLGHEVLINPTFKPRPGGSAVADEACYSVDNADRSIKVRRFVHGRLYATLPNGRRIKRHVRGFAARMVQHEIDHLDGITIDTCEWRG